MNIISKVNGVWRVFDSSRGGYYMGIKASTRKQAKEQLAKILSN